MVNLAVYQSDGASSNSRSFLAQAHRVWLWTLASWSQVAEYWVVCHSRLPTTTRTSWHWVGSFSRSLKRCEMRCGVRTDLHIERTHPPSTVTGGGLGLRYAQHRRGRADQLYPGDVLLCWPDDNGKGEAQEIAIRLGRNTSESYATAPFDFGSDAWRYGVHTSATRAICGDPSQAFEPAYHGHFANDAVRCERAGTQGRSTLLNPRQPQLHSTLECL